MNTIQLNELREEAEQNFIAQLLEQLARRANLPTGDWDTEDDCAEYIASCIAGELKDRDLKIAYLEEVLKPRQYDCYWSRRALEAEKKLKVIHADSHFIDAAYLEKVGFDSAAKAIRNIREKSKAEGLPQ